MKITDSTLLFFLIWLALIILNITAVINIELLAHDGINYKHSEDFVIVDFLGLDAMNSYTDIETGDTLFLIDNQRILNKHFLYNRIFEKHRPGDTLRYVLQRKGIIKSVDLELIHYYSLTRRLYMYIASAILSISTLLCMLYNRFKSVSFFHFCTICMIAASLILFINIPFSNVWQYLIFISLIFIMISLLYLFSTEMIVNTFRWNTFIFVLLIVGFPALLWIIFYIKWTSDLGNNTYFYVQFFMKCFHLTGSAILMASIYSMMKKLLYAHNISAGINIYMFIIILIVILIMYPVFLALPVIFRSRELFHFEYYLSFITILPVMTLLKSNRVIFGIKE